MINYLVILILPFMQLGFSYYASVSTIIFILIVSRYSIPILTGVASTPWLWAATFMMFVPAVMYSEQFLTPDLLRVGREALCLVALVGAVRGIESSRFRTHPVPPLKLVVSVLSILLILELAQVFALSRGQYLGIPSAYYTMGTGTIANETSLRFNDGSLRPSATFSEPSYYSFVLLSLGMLIANGLPRRLRLIGFAIIVVSGLISRSLAFIVFGTVIAILPELRPSRFRARYLGGLGIAVLVSIPVFAYTNIGVMFSRLANVVSSTEGDQSTNTRIADPLSILPQYLSENPVGQPISKMIATATSLYHGSSPLSFDSAFLGFFFLYGLLAFPIIITILWATRDIRTRLFLFSCMWFNGGYLRIDLVSLMIMGIAYYNAGLRRQAIADQDVGILENESALAKDADPATSLTLRSFRSV